MNKKDVYKIELLAITVLLAFCSIVYELLLSNTLAIVTGNYIWWQAFTIGVYIGGLGLGAFLSNRIRNIYSGLVLVELILSLLGAISVVYVYFCHSSFKYLDNLFYFSGDFYSSLYQQNLFLLKIVFFVSAQVLTLAIGTLSGFEIPLLMRISEDRLGIEEEGEHRILGFNYFGTLVGTICFAYFLFPKLDVILTSVCVAFLNILVCIYCLFKYLPKMKKFYSLAIGIVLSLIAVIGFNESRITQNYLKIFYFIPNIISKNNIDIEGLVRNLDQLKPIERTKSLYQYIDILTRSPLDEDNGKDSTVLTLDTNFQFSTSTEIFYHQGFAHVSIILNKIIPKKILLLGGGDGLLIRELVKYKEIESIKHIELDKNILDLAKTRFAELNKHSLSDPRVHTEINDGFYFLRNSTEKFDAIFIDFPYPNSYDLARLFSVEFYTYVRKALNPEGFVILDAPFYNKENNTKDKYQSLAGLSRVFNDRHMLNNSVLASTFYYAGFKSVFPYGIGEESFVFLKTEPGRIDFNFMESADFSKIDPRIIREMKQIKNEEIPYVIAEKYINSIFKPKLVRKNEF